MKMTLACGCLAFDFSKEENLDYFFSFNTDSVISFETSI